MKRYFFSLFLLLSSVALPLVLSTQDPKPTPIATDTLDQNVEISELKTPFTDTEDHWAEDAIYQLHNNNVIEGYSDGTFKPNDFLTRGQAVKIAMTAFGLDTSSMEGSHSTFSDVVDSDWFKNYVVYGVEIGIISGYEDNTFHPNATITRAEALKIILETAGFITLSSTENNFSDVDSVRDWFAKYSAFAKKAGLVTGYEDGTFRGNNEITRAEICVIVQKLIDYMAGQE